MIVRDNNIHQPLRLVSCSLLTVTVRLGIKNTKVINMDMYGWSAAELKLSTMPNT